MEHRQDVLDLQQELRVSAQLIEQLAKRMTRVSKLICKMGNIHLSDNEKKWTFPKNDYDWLSTWITTDDYAIKEKHKWKTESWPAYASRLSKFIGWDVKEDILRRCLKYKTGVEKGSL